MRVVVGTINGLVKVVDVEKGAVAGKWGIQREEYELDAHCWGRELSEGRELLLARKDGSIVGLNVEEGLCVTRLWDYKDYLPENTAGDMSRVCGMEYDGTDVNGKLIVCTRNGSVLILDASSAGEEGEGEPVESLPILISSHSFEVKGGKHIEKMRKFDNVVAAGGKEFDLALRDATTLAKKWEARNVKDDFLQMRVPVHIKDLQFLGEPDKLVTCTAHHQVRVYDVRAQRRPVMDISNGEYPFNAITSVTQGKYSDATKYIVVASNTVGDMTSFDLRKAGVVAGGYKGHTGSVRSICRVGADEDSIASCGLDRYLIVHGASSRVIQKKIFLKQRLNFVEKLPDKPTQSNGVDVEGRSDGKQSPKNENREDADELDEEWQEMEVVQEIVSKKRKKKASSSGSAKDEKKSKRSRKASSSSSSKRS